MSLIQQIPIPCRSRADSWFWLNDDKGKYSVRSCYRMIQGERECVHVGFWKKVWGLKVPGKVVNFL